MVNINIYSIPPFIGASLLFLIGLFVFLKDIKSRINRTLFFLTTSTFVWLAGYAILYSIQEENIAVLWVKIFYVCVVFIPIFFHHFTIAYFKIKNPIFLRLTYGFGLLFCFFLFKTNLLVTGVYKYYWGYHTKVGVIHFVYQIFFMVLFSRCLWLLWHGYKKALHISTTEANRVKYLFWAFFVSTIASLDFLPNYGIEIYPIGFIFMSGWVIITAYAIVKHQLLDIEIVIKKTLVFAGLFIVSYGVFAGIAYVGSTFFEKIIYNKWIAMIPSVVIIVLILRPLENFLLNVTDKYLFQKKYDYRHLLRTFSDEVLTVLGLKDLVEMTVNKLAETVKLSFVEMYLFDEDTREYVLAATTFQEPEDKKFEINSPFILYMKETEKYLHHEGMSRGESGGDKIIGFPEGLNSALIIPLLHNQELLGFLSLGKKKSDEEYSQDDIDILIPLAKTISIAIANARLFSQLTEAHAQAAQREKMAVIGTLSAGINHEICNPLGIARGQCELFLLNYSEGVYKDKDPEELIAKAQEIMNKVIHETDRATVITRKLSAFAKPAKGELTSDVNVENEIDEVISLLEHELRLANVKIVKNSQGNMPMIEADRKQLQEVFFNIIRNGAQAISDSGTITIEVTHANNKVQVDITDTGSGIGKKVQSRIFDPFFTTKEPGKGTGLGLFLVKQIVERNNGTISVNSEIGKGTTFSMVFKAVEAE